MSDFDDEALEAARQELNNSGSPEERRAFVYACEFSEIPPNGRRAKVIEGEIALVNMNGEIFAFSNLCPHEDSPVLGAGFFDATECKVACPLHGWMYELQTGKRLDGPGSIPVFDVRREGDEVWVLAPVSE